MGDKTPKRLPNSALSGFSPITLPHSPAAVSPRGNLTGYPRVIRDLVADLYNTIQRWNDVHIKGATTAKEIASVKADNPRDYTDGLQQLTNELYKAVQELRRFRDGLGTFRGQMDSLAKLQKTPEPVFISRDMVSLARLVGEVSQAYEAEFKVKEFVLEHIAHAKEKSEAMFLAALWTYQYKIGDEIALKLETLLVETGHRKVQ